MKTKITSLLAVCSAHVAKVRLHTIIVLLFLVQLAVSQTLNYNTVTGTLGTGYSWIDCAGGTTVVTGDDAQASVAWPFNFRFYDSNYTSSNTLSVCTNGFIRLDGTANSNYSTANAYTFAGNTLGQIIAMGVSDNLVSGSGWVRYLTTGTAPNRIFTVEYNNLQIPYNTSTYADVQVSFYESTNKIVIKFGDDNVSQTGAELGIHSGTAGYLHSWQNVDNGTNNSWIEYTINVVEVNSTGGTPVQYYTTLKGAFDAINAGTHTGVISVKINESTTELTTASLNASGTGSASYSAIKIFPTKVGLTVSGSLSSPLIQFNGADNVTLDGRVNESGAANLTISNSSTASGARTIELLNSAEQNNVQYCNIKGAGASTTQGTIHFGTSIAGNGNDGNYIQYNNLTSVSASNRPVNLIYSVGATGYVNSQNYIRNNNFYDFLNLGIASSAISVGAFSTDFSITDNHFYQTTSFVPTASVEHSVIRVDNSSGINFNISGNFIGGSAVSASGTWTKTNAFNNTFSAIYLNVGASNNSIQNNIIRNFNYANSGAANFTAINVVGGAVNVGNVNANSIGSSTGTGSIVFTGGATGAAFYGISVSSTANVLVSNNIIGSVTVVASASTNATNFYGLYKSASAGNITFNANKIGSEVTANSINASSISTSNSQIVYGIYNLGTAEISIVDNIISNMTNSTTETTLSSRIRGIFSNAGTNTVQSNTVYKLISSGLSNGANYPNASIVGISVISKLLGSVQRISENTVYSLETPATGKIEMYGIYFDGPHATNALISRNFVHTFVVPASPSGSTGSYLHGISLQDGSFITSNNIVYLGNNINTGCSIWGIWTNTNDDAKVYHNTVYLSGTALSGTSNSYAFRSLNCPATVDIRNNILWDGRVNSSGTISHYAIYLDCTSNVTLDYNDYQFAQRFGIAGGTTYNTFATWKAGTGFDTNSLNVDPVLVNLGGTLPIDYQTNVQLVGTTLGDVPTDFDNVTRVSPTMGAWEFFENPVETWVGGIKQETYSRLKLAFDDINSGQYQGDITIKFRGNTTETESAVLNASGKGSANYSRILIIPARSGIVVTGNLNAPIVDLNGADNVIFDGRVDGSGDAYEFSFVNTSTSSIAGTSVFRLYNTAQSDTVRYCNIKGSATGSATANIVVGSATVGAGNNNNVFQLNKITSVTNSNRPTNVFYLAGSSGFANSSNKILSNEIFDFLRPNAISSGVNIVQYTSNTTISGNSFYETTSFAPSSSVAYNIISIDDVTSNGNVISSNYIGGSAALAAGTWTKTNAADNAFSAIRVNVGSSTPTTIDGNIIRNISYSNSANASWNALKIEGGKVNVGVATANTVGASTGTGSIVITNGTTGGNIYAVNVSSASDVEISNNIIGSITVANATAANATNFIGIYKSASAGSFVVNNNTIGSTITANSIVTTSSATGSAQTLYGVNSDGTGAVSVTQNTIVNLSNATSNTTAATRGRVNGILISAGSSNTISQNTVRNLSIANANTATDFEMAVVGINLINTSANRTVAQNTVSALTNSYASFAGFVSGIYMRAATSATNTVTRNFVHSISLPSAAASMMGIVASSGNVTYSNNIVVLGDATNNVVYGLYDVNNSGQTTNAYFNTVYISGSTAGNNFSYAMYSGNAAGTRNYRNNIFNNLRTRSSGNGCHIAMHYAVGGAANLTVNYNNYRVGASGGATLGRVASTNLANLNAIQTETGQDGNSVTTNATFTNAGSLVATDYKVGVTLTGIAGAGVAVDYGAFSRPATNPTMGAWEKNVNRWKGTNTTDWGTASNWTGNLVPEVDANIEFDPAPVNHCVMDIDRSVTNIINAQGTYRVVTNGKNLTIKGDLQFTNGAQIDASSASTKVIIAGVNAQSIPAGSFYNNQVYHLEVNNSNNVSLHGTIKLLGSITATAGRFDTYTNLTSFEFAGVAAQTIEANVFLDNKAHNLTIDNGVGVTLNTDFSLNNNLGINAAKKLTISAAKTLTVNGTVTNLAGTSGLVIKSSSSLPNGSLIFFNSELNAVQASVEMFSRSTWDLSQPSGSRYNWQYFGIPVRTLGALPTFYGGYVRQRNEAGTTTANHWVQLGNSSVLSPFIGYELGFQTQRTITMSGELVNSNFNSGQLAKTSGAIYPGQHILANPYAAAIDIRQIEFGSDMEATVYLYNTGSFNSWESNTSKLGSTPGQYVSVPKNLAGYAGIPRQVPSMSSMLTKVITSTTNAYVNISYNAVKMGNSEIQRAPSKNKDASLDEESLVSSSIILQGTTRADNMWIFVDDRFTRSFDNGYDGKKVSPAAGMPRIYGSETDFNYNINAVNDLNNSVLGFRAGVDSVYTLKFEHKNTELKYQSIYLLDTKTDVLTDITANGSTYTFKAFNKTTSEDRFRIVSTPLNTTSTVNVFAADYQLFIKKLADVNAVVKITDVAGHVLFNEKIEGRSLFTLPVSDQTVYIVTVTTNEGTSSQKLIVRKK